MNIVTASESAMVVYLASKPNVQLLPQIALLRQRIWDEFPTQLVEVVPAATSIYLQFSHPQFVNAARKKIRDILLSIDGNPEQREKGRVIDVPVHYGQEHGEDFTSVCEQTGLSASELIELHSSLEYTAFAVGFAPGFAYLGELPEQLRLPRLSTPRTRVPKGSVAIADKWTAVYPQSSPGGWLLIGATDQQWFDKQQAPYSKVQVGDRVRFVAMPSHKAARR